MSQFTFTETNNLIAHLMPIPLGEGDSAMAQLLMSRDILSQDILPTTPNHQYTILIKLLDVPLRARPIASFH